MAARPTRLAESAARRAAELEILGAGVVCPQGSRTLLVNSDSTLGRTHRLRSRSLTAMDDYGTWLLEARARLGDDAVFVGPSAAWAHGCRLAGAATPIHVAVGRNHWPRAQPGVIAYRTDVPVDSRKDSQEFGRITTPLRTLVDLGRGVGTTGLADAGLIVWADAMLHATATPVAAARTAAMATTGLRGMTASRRIMHRARDGAESVKETELRLLLVRLGLPEPETQCTVRTPTGEFVARLDMGWRLRRVGVEYDGAGHLERRQHSRDLMRHNRLRWVGWTVISIDAWSLARPWTWAGQLRTALSDPRAGP